jgi:20S proteasome alpha/beta subunit
LYHLSPDGRCRRLRAVGVGFNAKASTAALANALEEETTEDTALQIARAALAKALDTTAPAATEDDKKDKDGNGRPIDFEEEEEVEEVEEMDTQVETLTLRRQAAPIAAAAAA